MKFGLTESEYEFVITNAFMPLKKAGARVWIFGSRARGEHHPFSDVDLMADAPQDLTRLLSDIQERFSKSNFPYKLDLVQLSQFAASYLPGFEKEKIELRS